MLFPHLLSSLENVAELQVKIKGKGRKMTIEPESDGSGVIETRLSNQTIFLPRHEKTRSVGHVKRNEARMIYPNVCKADFTSRR